MRVFERLDELYAIGGGPGANRPHPRRPRTRRIGSRPAGSRRLGSRSRSTATATSSDCRASGAGRCRRLWVGSHLDSVPQGGRFDGALGVVAAIEAVERVGSGSVVVFRGEEVGCVGSRARVAAGGQLPRTFLELHVEQGPVLAERDVPVGVVTGIVGYARGELVLEGRAGHAGTTPMVGRDDALVAAAGEIQRVRDAALEIPGAVATVGKARRRARRRERDSLTRAAQPRRPRAGCREARRARRLDRFRPDLPRRACPLLRGRATGTSRRRGGSSGCRSSSSLRVRGTTRASLRPPVSTLRCSSSAASTAASATRPTSSRPMRTSRLRSTCWGRAAAGSRADVLQSRRLRS